jgi:hypothetical protein
MVSVYCFRSWTELSLQYVVWCFLNRCRYSHDCKIMWRMTYDSERRWPEHGWRVHIYIYIHTHIYTYTTKKDSYWRQTDAGHRHSGRPNDRHATTTFITQDGRTDRHVSCNATVTSLAVNSRLLNNKTWLQSRTQGRFRVPKNKLHW